jgi:hypothetical protein
MTMRRDVILGVVLLGLLAFAGCNDDDDTTPASGGTPSSGGSTGTTGGSTGTTGGITSTGGSTGTAGGTEGTDTGGTTAAAGQNAGGEPGDGGSSLGLPLTADKTYVASGFSGSVWTANDTDGSTIALAANNTMCVSGTAIQIPTVDGAPDYSGAWGVDLGWNLNETLFGDGGSEKLAADVSNKTSINVGLSGATGLTLRVQFEVVTGGTSAYYCATLPVTGGAIPIANLRTDCWGATGLPFDKATMQPISFAIQVVTDTGKAYPFDFCVTSLSID